MKEFKTKPRGLEGTCSLISSAIGQVPNVTEELKNRGLDKMVSEVAALSEKVH